MLKQYRWRGSQWQFDDKSAPADAVEIKAEAEKTPEVKEKAVTAPSNKAFKGSKKK